MIKKVLLFVFTIMLVSCSNQQEKELRQSISNFSSNEVENPKAMHGATLAQYRDQEKILTDNYIKGLKDIVEKSFDRQIEVFEDKELGVLSGYKYMFKYIISSEQEWIDLQLQLSDRYFNSILLQQEAYEYSNEYINRIKELRTQFYKDKSGVNMPQVEVLQIPRNQIFVGGLVEHSRTNLAIEFGTAILDWLLGILIVWVVVNIIGYATTGPMGCVISIVSFLIMMLISVLCTRYNDGKLVDSLKAQHESFVLDYDILHKSLNDNSIKFYDSLK